MPAPRRNLARSLDALLGRWRPASLVAGVILALTVGFPIHHRSHGHAAHAAEHTAHQPLAGSHAGEQHEGHQRDSDADDCPICHLSHALCGLWVSLIVEAPQARGLETTPLPGTAPVRCAFLAHLIRGPPRHA